MPTSTNRPTHGAWTLKAAEHAASLYAGEEAERLYGQALAIGERLEAGRAIAAAAAGLAELAAHRGTT